VAGLWTTPLAGRPPVLRATAAMVAVVNLLASGGAVMVLFAQEKPGVDAVGFGLLFSGSAVGGVLGSLVATRVTRAFGLRAVRGRRRGHPLTTVLCLPAVNTRTIAEARAAAGLEPGPWPGYIRSGASTLIRPRVLASTWRVALTSHQRALERAWSSPRTRHSA
jgi:hypothetical protein